MRQARNIFNAACDRKATNPLIVEINTVLLYLSKVGRLDQYHNPVLVILQSKELTRTAETFHFLSLKTQVQTFCPSVSHLKVSAFLSTRTRNRLTSVTVKNAKCGYRSRTNCGHCWSCSSLLEKTKRSTVNNLHNSLHFTNILIILLYWIWSILVVNYIFTCQIIRNDSITTFLLNIFLHLSDMLYVGSRILN